jgi:hypothetical protein
LAVSEGIDVSLIWFLILRFGLTGKESAGLKPGATWPKNENASRDGEAQY